MHGVLFTLNRQVCIHCLEIMLVSTNTPGARDRLLAAASHLFYEEGYLATGINRLIEEAGVAKASFYQHFASKEELCSVYLAVSHERLIQSLERELNRHDEPRDRVLAVFDFLERLKEESRYRGCPFLNIMAEISSADSPLRAQALRHYDVLRAIVRQVVEAFAKADRPDLAESETVQLGESLVLLFEGALVSSQNYAASWPIETARTAAERLIDS